ncbi:MAG: phosphoadenosine phosphosulfate reductase family protein [Deltaproteobacteria bacterium]|nr:phosphoadenosine phosphosulfate reductase family protein [Deltaproteobacteria bacterium]
MPYNGGKGKRTAGGDTGNKVLLVSLDNVRYDCLSYVKEKPHLKQFYVENLVDTPTIDEIASGAAVFTNCFSTSSYTTSAHASLFTGLLQPKHGVRPFFYKKLRKDCVTLAEIYKKGGYKTVLYSDVIELFQPLGLTKGFDYVYAGDINALFKQLGTFEKDEKVFCFVHLFDAHEPYIYSQNYNENHYNDEYYAFMNKMSSLYKIPVVSNDPFALWNNFSGRVNYGVQIMLPPYIYGINKFDNGRFRLIHNTLKDFGYFNEENIYSIFADHGEGRIALFDPPVFGHMGELFDEVIHIPLMLHAPQLENKTYDGLVSIVDMFPTLLSLSGLEAYTEIAPLPSADHNDDGANSPVLLNLDGQPIFAETERQYCYSEFCTQNMYNEIMQFNAAVYDRNKNGASLKDRYFLSQRAVRTKDKKYMFIPDNISQAEGKKIVENVNLSDEDFIIEMFNSVMRKRVSKPEYLSLLKALKTKQTTRANIYQGMIASELYNRPKNFYFDLLSDPFEEKPIILNLSLTDSVKYIEILNKIEKDAFISENLFDDNNPDSKGKAKIIFSQPESEGNIESATAELLNQKTSLSIEIIKEAYDRFGDKIGIAFTGGKDSSVLLDLTRRAFDGKIPFKVITIDTSAEFPEIKEFIEKLKQSWGFELLTYSNAEALKQKYPIAKDKADCCNTLKTIPLKQSIKDLHLKAMFTGIRKDENEARANEVYFSKRKDPHHFRVHPILHFTEADIWLYIKLNNLPYCTLYEQGYRSIDCAPCTNKTTMDKSIAERSGRSQDKEAAMDKLRQLGYF